MKIYIFGNPMVKKDSLPLKLLPKFRELHPRIEFVVVDPNENFPPIGEKKLIILDTVLGIKKPEIFDLDSFQKKDKTPISPHDYDLLFHLLLLKKLKKIEKVIIIGIPSCYNLNKIVNLKRIIKKEILRLVPIKSGLRSE